MWATAEGGEQEARNLCPGLERIREVEHQVLCGAERGAEATGKRTKSMPSLRAGRTASDARIMNQRLARHPRLWLCLHLSASQSLLAKMHSALIVCQVLF